MIELGDRSDILGEESLQPLGRNPAFERCFVGSRPIEFPALRDDEAVICGLKVLPDTPERLYVCESLEEMDALYRRYYSGMESFIEWYYGPRPTFITIMPGDAQL